MSEQPNEIVTEALDAVAGGRDLSAAEASAVLAEIMRGAVSATQIAGFLIALRTKGETVDELAGLAQTMRELAIRVEVRASNLLDTAGTGGGRRSFNVSTTAALIAAGAGCSVAKHGNRSATEPVGLRRSAGGAGSADRPRRRRRRALHRRDRLRLHVRPCPPPGDPLRGRRSAASSPCARSSTSSDR